MGFELLKKEGFLILEYFNILSTELVYENPLQTDGNLIFSNNVTGFPLGGLSKRPGYGTFQAGSLSAQVNTLFSYAPYPTGAGTQLFVYAASGSGLYYSVKGTGAWTIATGGTSGDSGGTITNGNHVGYAVLNNVLILGDGAGSTRHTTVGTTFSNTTLAPVAQYFSQFGGQVFASQGTSSNLFWSTSNDATNWNIGGTSNSSFIVVPNEGGVLNHFVAGDRLNIMKQRGDMFHWDNTSLVDLSTKYGPSSPWSVANIDDTWYWLNQYGIFNYDGAVKNLISNPIQRWFYNKLANGIGTASWGSAPATGHVWDYLVAVGTISDDFTGRTINNAIIKYDFQKNQFHAWSFADAPTAFHSFNDINQNRQLIFGNAAGQVFQLDRTKTSDNGTAIATEAVFLFTYSSQGESFTQSSAQTLPGLSYEKKWNWIRLFFNPGDEVNIQFAFTNTLTYQHLKWSEPINSNKITGDFYQISDGVVEVRFPVDPNNMPRSRFMFLRIYDNSDSSSWNYFGASIDAEIQVIK